MTSHRTPRPGVYRVRGTVRYAYESVVVAWSKEEAREKARRGELEASWTTRQPPTRTVLTVDREPDES